MQIRQYGITAIELMVALAISALLITLALPSLREHQANQQMRSAIYALQSALTLARNQAINSNYSTVVCPRSTTNGCGAADDWAYGWQVFSDQNGDREPQADEPVLSRHGATEGVSIQTSSARRRLRFLPNGTAPGSNATIVFCDARGARSARQLTLSNSGRIKWVDAGDKNGADCASQ